MTHALDRYRGQDIPLMEGPRGARVATSTLKAITATFADAEPAAWAAAEAYFGGTPHRLVSSHGTQRTDRTIGCGTVPIDVQTTWVFRAIGPDPFAGLTRPADAPR